MQSYLVFNLLNAYVLMNSPTRWRRQTTGPPVAKGFSSQSPVPQVTSAAERGDPCDESPA